MYIFCIIMNSEDIIIPENEIAQEIATTSVDIETRETNQVPEVGADVVYRHQSQHGQNRFSHCCGHWRISQT